MCVSVYVGWPALAFLVLCSRGPTFVIRSDKVGPDWTPPVRLPLGKELWWVGPGWPIHSIRPHRVGVHPSPDASMGAFLAFLAPVLGGGLPGIHRAPCLPCSLRSPSHPVVWLASVAVPGGSLLSPV